MPGSPGDEPGFSTAAALGHWIDRNRYVKERATSVLAGAEKRGNRAEAAEPLYRTNYRF